MQIIVTGRQAGKTAKLITIAADRGWYIVCSSKPEAARINEQARALELQIHFPITYTEFIEHKYHGKGISGFVIDNAELLLQFMTEVPIGAISMTGAPQDGR